MNIGLDIDGCLTDIETFHLKYGVPFFEKKFNKSVVNEYGKSRNILGNRKSYNSDSGYYGRRMAVL